MITWHWRGCDGTTPRCRSRNIAKNSFSEGWLQKSYEFAGLRTVPATHHAKNTENNLFSCGMLQNAAIPWEGGWWRTANQDLCTYEILRAVPYMPSRIANPPCGDVCIMMVKVITMRWNLGLMVQDGPPLKMINCCCRLKNNEVEVCQNRLDGINRIMSTSHRQNVPSAHQPPATKSC